MKTLPLALFLLLAAATRAGALPSLPATGLRALTTAHPLMADPTDLFRSLHGQPPDDPPLPPDTKAAAVSFAPGVKEDGQILDFMLAFAEATRLHNGKALKPRLSDKYTIEDVPEDQSAPELFLRAMAKIKSSTELVVTAIVREGEVRVASVEFRNPDRPAKTKVFRFDTAGKLLSADFFALKRHGM